MKTKDGFPIEHQMSDANLPPGTKGQGVNTVALWIRLPGDDWYRVKSTRSTWSVMSKVGVLDLIELKAVISSGML